MGTRCSTTGIKGIVIPSKKIDPNVTSPPNGRRGSAGLFRVTKADDRTTDTVRSPDNPIGVTIKHRGTQGDHVDSTGKHITMTQMSETVLNTHYTESSNAKAHSQYKKGPEIGKGTYSEVYESLDLNTGELLAVKSFKIHGDTAKISNYIETLKKEITSLRNLGHQNIVKYYTCDITRVPDSNYAIVNVVLEYVSGKSVRKLLDNFCGLEEKVVGTYIRQVLEGLAYLHLNGIVHRNIKGSNILIDTAGTIKLTDFGCSGRPDRFSEDNPQENNNKAAAKNLAFWSAPEVIMRKSQGKPADVWSVGCVVIEMLTGQPPWSDLSKNPDEFIKQISSGTPPPLPKDISENCRDFLFKAFKFKPEDRPSPLDLLDHPFVRDHNHENSDIEAESVQTFSYNPGTGKNLDFFVDPKSGERKYMDLKTNNFVKKQIKSKHLSMSNINFIPGNSVDSHGRIVRKVTEANFYEDSARSDPKGSFFKFRRNSTKKSDGLAENPQFMNDSRPPTFGEEGEVMNNYMQGNLSQLKKKQHPHDQEKIGAEKKPIVPKKNLLFADNEEGSGRRENDDKKSPTEKWISEKTPPKKNPLLVERESSDKVEDISSQMDRNSVSTVPLADNKQEGNEVKDDAEMKLMQEKLRRQFEEQMEISLARGNSEKFDGGFDGFENSEMGDIHVTDKVTRNLDDANSSQYVKTSTDHLKDFWKIEDSANDLDKTSMKKAEEDMLGNFRGVWDTHAEEIEASLKRSPSRTESDGRSPDEKYTRKMQADAIFNHKDAFYGIEREELSPDFQSTDVENYKEREIVVNEEEKLGIINEAEEIKEDSGDEAVGRTGE